LDFGISKFNQMSGDSGFSMTRTGAVMGTPYHMAPEQAKGARDLDHRVDLYAAGVILYEAITGEVPFNADTFNELLFKIVLETARPVEQIVPGIDPSFAAIVNKSMAREPAHRFQSAKEFQQVLEQWAAGAGPQFAAALNASAQAPAARAPMPSASGTGQYPAAVPAQTSGNWANTGGVSPAAIRKQSHTGLFVVLGVLGLLVVGGGGIAAFALSKGKDEAAAAAAKVESERVEAEKAKAAQAEKSAQEVAEKAKAEAEKAKAESEALKSEAEKAKAGLAAAEAAAASAKSASAKVAIAAPRTFVAPAAKPEPKPPATPPATPAAASTGRKIRTSL
jgi:serine/threonine-protein kinase